MNEHNDEIENDVQSKNIESFISENNFDNSKEELVIEHLPLIIPRGFFNSYLNIVKLVLTDCNLKKMPRSILNLSNLNYLDISNNDITYIPIEIGKIKKLTTLKYENTRCRPLTDFINVSQFKDLIDISRFVMDRQLVPPPVRDFIPYNNQNCFTIMSYNILCAKYTNQSIYPLCLKKCLDFKYRFPLILEEIKKYKPHIICLQEVQYGLFYSTFQPEIESLGYKGFYAPKDMYEKAKEADKPFVLGQATFITLQKEDDNDIYFDVESEVATNIAFRSSPYLKQGNCPRKTKKYSETALIVNVKVKRKNDDNGYSISIVNTHLQWKPTCDDVRADQLKIAVCHAVELAKKKNDLYDIIVCGDFNSYPDTPAIAFMNNHPEHFISSYDAMKQPFYLSHLTCDFEGLLDYIYTTQNKIEVASVLPLYPDDVIHSMALEIPDTFHPSDHLPIIAALRIK